MSDDMTLDDLTVVGIDGIRRTFDEHYDTMMCVEQDPTGAHHAIHNQHARIEELEGQLKNVLDREAATFARYDAKLDAAEAKLAKAVEALELTDHAIMENTTDQDLLMWGEPTVSHIRTTLAELRKP